MTRAFALGHASSVPQTCRTASGWYPQLVATDMPGITLPKYGVSASLL